MKNKTNGFSLLEVLIVVVIIAIVFAIIERVKVSYRQKVINWPNLTTYDVYAVEGVK